MRCRRAVAEELELPRVLPRHRHGRRRRRLQRRRHRPHDHVVPAEQEPQPAAVEGAQIEQYLQDYYGQEHVLWLGDGIEGDDTDGHVDDLARFVDARTIVIGIEDDPTRRELRGAAGEPPARSTGCAIRTAGRSTIVELPMPRPVAYEGQRLPATYMNFYFVNGALLVPTFGQPHARPPGAGDPAARLPGRRVVGVDCRDAHLGPRRDSLPDAAASRGFSSAEVRHSELASGLSRPGARC